MRLRAASSERPRGASRKQFPLKLKDEGKECVPAHPRIQRILRGGPDCGPVSPCSPIEADKRHSLVEEKDTRTGMSPLSVADVMNKGWKERFPGGRIFEWVLKGK